MNKKAENFDLSEKYKNPDKKTKFPIDKILRQCYTLPQQRKKPMRKSSRHPVRNHRELQVVGLQYGVVC